MLWNLGSGPWICVAADIWVCGRRICWPGRSDHMPSHIKAQIRSHIDGRIQNHMKTHIQNHVKIVSKSYGNHKSNCINFVGLVSTEFCSILDCSFKLLIKRKAVVLLWNLGPGTCTCVAAAILTCGRRICWPGRSDHIRSHMRPTFVVIFISTITMT